VVVYWIAMPLACDMEEVKGLALCIYSLDMMQCGMMVCKAHETVHITHMGTLKCG